MHRIAATIDLWGRDVTKLGKPGTSSAADVTNADAAKRPALPWAGRAGRIASPRGLFAVWAACVLAVVVVNAFSVSSDLVHRGVAFEPLEPWIWELTSGAGLVMLGPLVWMFETLVRARVERTGWRVVAHVLASFVFCTAHIAVMVVLRLAIYRLNGWHYNVGPWLEGFLYEYRKDALTYALIAGCIWLWRSSVQPMVVVDAPEVDSAVAAAPVEPTFVVRTLQGDVLVRTAEIEWVEAQGNYVALHTAASEVRLLRQTLAEVEARLAPHGFIRTHRSALVNRSRIQAIVPAERGSPGLRLASGGLAPLSESRRSEVLRLVSGE
jgi:hypothetical protein